MLDTSHSMVVHLVEERQGYQALMLDEIKF